MTIKSIEEKLPRNLEIDLTGSEGNTFYILGVAKKLSRQLDKDWELIKSSMTAGDYEELIRVFEEEFGNYVTLYR